MIKFFFGIIALLAFNLDAKEVDILKDYPLMVCRSKEHAVPAALAYGVGNSVVVKEYADKSLCFPISSDMNIKFNVVEEGVGDLMGQPITVMKIKQVGSDFEVWAADFFCAYTKRLPHCE